MSRKKEIICKTCGCSCVIPINRKWNNCDDCEKQRAVQQYKEQVRDKELKTKKARVCTNCLDVYMGTTFDNWCQKCKKGAKTFPRGISALNGGGMGK